MMRGRSYYGNMMVEMGEADAFISGLTRNYPTAIRPALDIIGKEEGVSRIAGMHVVWAKKGGPFFFAPTPRGAKRAYRGKPTLRARPEAGASTRS